MSVGVIKQVRIFVSLFACVCILDLYVRVHAYLISTEYVELKKAVKEYTHVHMHVRLYAVCVYISCIIAWGKGNQNMHVTWLCVV